MLESAELQHQQQIKLQKFWMEIPLRLPQAYPFATGQEYKIGEGYIALVLDSVDNGRIPAHAAVDRVARR